MQLNPTSNIRRPASGLRQLLFGLLASCLCLPAFGQFSMDWHTIDGGGGTSTGAVYSVTGTIGQPDAGPVMTNGQYSVIGGFWALPALVQTTNAPTLYITNAGPGWATIWWNPPTPGYTLLVSPAVAPTTWTNAPSGTNNPALVPTTLPARFYRLHKP